MDLGRGVGGEKALSPWVWTVGGRLGYLDDGAPQNPQVVFHDYPAAPLIFEVRGLPASATSDKMDLYHGAGVGVVVDCEGGRMVIPDYSGATFYDKQDQEIKRFKGRKSHFANFLSAVR